MRIGGERESSVWTWISTIAAMALWAGSIGTAGATTPPRFGGEDILASDYSYLTSVGANVYEVGVSWAKLMPDGVTLDANAIAALDRDVRNAYNAGVRQMLIRVTPSGGEFAPFAGPKSGWPVDTTAYTYKDGEYLGNQVAAGTESYPPKVLTLDTAGDTSPWYDFVHLLATRYDGNTVDPLDSSKKLPRIDLWSCVEQPDQKTSWYGTSMDYYGGVGGNAAVGTLPSFARAVKASSATAVVEAGGFSSTEVGLYLVHEMGRAHGNTYDAAVRAYGVSYFNTDYPMQQALEVNISDADLFTQFENDPERTQARLMIDRAFDPTVAGFYDVVAIHSYDNWQMLEDVIGFYRSRMAAPKPVWITELGFIDSPPNNQDSMLTEEDQASWLVKKLVIGLSDGIEHMSYSPVFGFAGYAEIYPSTTTERLARRSYQLIGRALNESSGYRYGSTFTSGGTEFHVFDHSDGASHIAVAWRASDSAQQDARAILGVPGAASFRVLDDVEHVISTGDGNVTFGTAPLAVFWSTATLDADGDGVPAPVDCNDTDATESPDLPEDANNGKDNDCDPVTPSGSGCGSIASSADGMGTLSADAGSFGAWLLAISLGRAARRRGGRRAR